MSLAKIIPIRTCERKTTSRQTTVKMEGRNGCLPNDWSSVTQNKEDWRKGKEAFALPALNNNNKMFSSAVTDQFQTFKVHV